MYHLAYKIMDNTTPKAIKLSDTTQAKTAKGSHGGGTPYHSAKFGQQFVVVDSRPGHSQKSNVKTDK